MKYTSNNYEVETILLSSGSYFLGQYIDTDTCYYIARDNVKDVIVSAFKGDLTPEIESDILRISKNLKSQQIQQEDDINLMDCFEYPTDSGQTFSIARKQFAYYNSLVLFKSSFVYPFEFLGNNGATTTFQDVTDVETFVGSALTKHQEVYMNRYIVAINSVNSVTITTTIDDAIVTIMSVIY